jgi:hypothetical protein
MDLSKAKKQILVESPRGLYKWSRIFNRLQRNFFADSTIKLRREKQIEDFIVLNGFKRVRFKTDTDLFEDFQIERVASSHEADIVVITDQKFSRFPCPVIIETIKNQIEKCPNLYLCLNRHYINIDNSFHDPALDSKFTRAITQWLQKSLDGYDVIDLSLDYVDHGRHFTWAVPDRHYFIKKYDKIN